MNKKRPSIDGFIPRRANSELGDLHDDKIASPEIERKSLHTGDEEEKLLGAPRTDMLIGRSDISESLDEIDKEYDEENHNKSFEHKAIKTAKRPSRFKKIIKWFFIVLLIAALGLGGYFATKLLLVQGNIFKGSIFDLVKNEPLKQDSNGRSNFLILGTTDDDPNHPGGALTDSMMILSINQTSKNAYMFSIPRDLYVNYNRACASGYSGKINVYFSCINDGKTDAEVTERLAKTQEFIGKIFGLDIQYGIHVNSKVLPQAVDAVGGIDVDIQGSNGAPGILDRNFDWGCDYKCYKVKYDNGVHHLNGEQASFLSMARGDTAPTYGLGNSNFDREKNQQKIILALKEKAVSTGTLTNIGKVSALLDALDKNIRTNIENKEIRTLMSLGTEIGSGSIKTISLFDGDTKVVTSGPYNGASVVMPVAGIFNYTKIQKMIKEQLSNDPVLTEGANLVVLNGSDTAGLAQTEADKLEAKNFTILSVGNSTKGTYSKYEIYVIDDTKTATLDALKAIYSGAVIKTTKAPGTVSADADIVVVIGSN